MKKAFAAAFLLAASAMAHAGDFAECSGYFVKGFVPKLPASAPKLQRPLCFDSFAVMHSGESKTALYTVEKLNRARLLDARDEERTNRFYAEARLPAAHRAQLSDYAGSGFDRGHLAPAADMPDAKSMAQSFSLANMVPQAPQNNRGIWAKSVEKPTRQYAMRAGGDVYVFTGPVFRQPVSTIGSGRVWVPSQLFKLVYDSSSGRAWAYWVDNTDDARMSKPITYQELVSRTGIQFLPAEAAH